MKELISKVKQLLIKDKTVSKTQKSRNGIMLDGVFVKETDPQCLIARAALGARRVHTDAQS